MPWKHDMRPVYARGKVALRHNLEFYSDKLLAKLFGAVIEKLNYLY